MTNRMRATASGPMAATALFPMMWVRLEKIWLRPRAAITRGFGALGAPGPDPPLVVRSKRGF